MPRRRRVFLPNQPQHIVVRGHNRDPILARVEDFRFLYRCLLEATEKHSLQVHAWVLMHNHLHLLATPLDALSIPRTMQTVGRRYAQYFNRCYHRSGALWEGRYKAALVDTDRYLLACYRYIELNPVRAGLVRAPADYDYSSYAANALGQVDKLVFPHDVYLQLIGGHEGEGERKAYVELFVEPLSRKELVDIRRGTEKGLGIGRADFLLRVAGLAQGG